jgi:hypothetical protein
MNAQCSWPNENLRQPEDELRGEFTRQHRTAAACVRAEHSVHIAHRIDLAANPAAGREPDWSVWSGCWPTCWRAG